MIHRIHLRRLRTPLFHALVGGYQPIGGRRLLPLGDQARSIATGATLIPCETPFGSGRRPVDSTPHTIWEMKPYFSV